MKNKYCWHRPLPLSLFARFWLTHLRLQCMCIMGMGSIQYSLKFVCECPNSNSISGLKSEAPNSIPWGKISLWLEGIQWLRFEADVNSISNLVGQSQLKFTFAKHWSRITNLQTPPSPISTNIYLSVKSNLPNWIFKQFGLNGMLAKIILKPRFDIGRNQKTLLKIKRGTLFKWRLFWPCK